MTQKSKEPRMTGDEFPSQRGFLLVEHRGFEPLTFSLRTRRATNCANAPTTRLRYHTLATPRHTTHDWAKTSSIPKANLPGHRAIPARGADDTRNIVSAQNPVQAEATPTIPEGPSWASAACSSSGVSTGFSATTGVST